MNKEDLRNLYLALLFLGVLMILSCKSARNKYDDKNIELQTIEYASDSLKNKFPEVTIKSTESRKLESQFTKENYEIDVFLPPEYNNDTIHYPIVFVLDAEYNFGCVTYITRRLIKNGDIPNVILVGIAYESDDEDYYYKTRMRDCTPPSKINGYNTGGA